MKQWLFISKKRKVQFYIHDKMAINILEINNITISIIDKMKNDIMKNVEKGNIITYEEKCKIKQLNEKINDIKNNLLLRETDEDLTSSFKMLKLKHGGE